LHRPKLIVTLALLCVAALHYSSVPRTFWEYDECLYASAVEKFEPLLHHPPPPGSPLYIAFVNVVALLIPNTLTAMLFTSALAVAAGFLAFVLAFTKLTDLRTGILAALLLYASPAVLISGMLPQAEAGALALLALAIWGCTSEGRAQRAEGRSERPWWVAPALCALPSALCIGWRMQLSIAVVPMFLAAVFLTMRTWRDRLIALGVFGVTCLAWLVPLVVATGGPVGFWTWMSSQAKYFAQHDADLSRSGQTLPQIALRFIAHPWGPKWLSLPLLGMAIAGIRRNRRVIPLAIGSLVYLVFAVATMDPADAVRYAIPSLPFIALLAGTTLASFGVRWPQPPLSYATEQGHRPPKAVAAATALQIVVVILYAAGSFWYAFPVLRARATMPSPPVAAARWIAANVPRNAIILFDLSLRPHAEYLLPGWKTMRIDEGSGQDAGNDPSVPIVLFVDGDRNDAITFRWPDTDAYRKLTRKHYRAVSVVPFPASRRLRVIEGVYPPERTNDGQAWRWIGARGVIELPQIGATRVRLTLRTPPQYPFDEIRVRIRSSGYDSVTSVRRNATAEVVVPIGPGPARITLTPERTFVPALLPGANNRDRRTLSVMLTRVQQLR
jgi:hypothetical protein